MITLGYCMLLLPLLSGVQQNTPPKTAGETVVEVPPRVDPNRCSPPIYPEMALRQKKQGTVVLEASINAKGEVTKLKLFQSSNFDLLDEAAKQAVEKWHFFPATRNGKPINSLLKIPFHFELQQPAPKR